MMLPVNILSHKLHLHVNLKTPVHSPEAVVGLNFFFIGRWIVQVYFLSYIIYEWTSETVC